MPNTSQLNSFDDNNDNLTNNGQDAECFLFDLFCQTQDVEHMQQLFYALLTDKERKELVNRIQIFALLQQELPQREIAKRLGVGIATVSRGAKAYQINDVANLLPNLKDKF